jgi:mTERF domain-containing protein, mitochondrial
VENTLIPKLQFLLSIGFSHKEVEFLVSRKPDLLTSSIENSIKPKAEYFFREIKGGLEELREFPHYFTYCLERRIKPRHRELVKKGIEMPVGVMLTSMEIEFRKLVAQLEKDNS